MRIKVRMGEPLWRAVRQKMITLALPDKDNTLADVLETLVAAYPNLEGELHGSGERREFYYTLFLNGQIASFSERAKVPVQEGDEVLILLPVAGG